MNKKELIEKLISLGYSVEDVSNFHLHYQLTIVIPLTDFYIIKSEYLNSIGSSIAFGFTNTPRVYMYNNHPLRDCYGLTTDFDFSTIDDLVEKVVSTTKSLRNLYEK